MYSNAFNCIKLGINFRNFTIFGNCHSGIHSADLYCSSEVSRGVPTSSGCGGRRNKNSSGAVTYRKKHGWCGLGNSQCHDCCSCWLCLGLCAEDHVIKMYTIPAGNGESERREHNCWRAGSDLSLPWQWWSERSNNCFSNQTQRSLSTYLHSASW